MKSGVDSVSGFVASGQISRVNIETGQVPGDVGKGDKSCKTGKLHLVFHNFLQKSVTPFVSDLPPPGAVKFYGVLAPVPVKFPDIVFDKGQGIFCGDLFCPGIFRCIGHKDSGFVSRRSL